MRIYLVVYFALLAGALVALWQGGVLGELPLLATTLVVAGAASLGVLLAVVTFFWHPHVNQKLKADS